MRISCEFDVKKFNTGLLKVKQEIRDATLYGMRVAMENFKYDCLNKPPACPVDTGRLRDSHEISVSKSGNVVSGTLRVDTPYAASIHEGISRWGTPYRYKTPGTGAKWIQSKALMYHSDYTDKIKKSVFQVFRKWFSSKT